MQRLIRGRRGGAGPTGRDDGAIATLVAILFAGGVLLGMAALVIDVGSLYGERRLLQNSADAGALSLAQDCAAQSPACAADASRVAAIVNRNDAADASTTVAGVCVHRTGGSAGACSSASASLADCLPLPSGADQYVEVRTSTRTASGGSLLAPIFGQAVDSSDRGTNVRACSRVAWGGPAGLTSALPLAISSCAFDSLVGSPPSRFAPSPPYPPYPAASWEHVLFLPGTPEAAAGGCRVPGGFGWLRAASCAATTTAGDWYDARAGATPGGSCRRNDLRRSLGDLVDLPVYDRSSGLGGPNGRYHVEGYVAFVLTGYQLGGSYSHRSVITGQYPCGRTPPTADQRCVSGFFTRDLTPTSGTIGGPYLGVAVVQMTG